MRRSPSVVPAETGHETYLVLNVADMSAGFRRADMLDDIATFKNLMVWFACETNARQITPERDLSGRAWIKSAASLDRRKTIFVISLTRSSQSGAR
jgi:hypothetical protein